MFINTFAKHSEREAIISKTRRVTYKQLKEKVDQVAYAFHSEWSIKPGDRVGLLLNNQIEFCIALLAVVKLGGIVVPLNTRLQGSELTYIINDCDPKLLIIDKQYKSLIETISERLNSIQKIFIIGEKGANDFEQLYGKIANDINIATKPEDTAIILYTSGTTGLPKGAMLSHLGISINTINIRNTLGTEAGERTLIAVPLFHVTGCVFQFLHMVSVGGSLVLMEKYETKEMINLLEKEHVTFFIGVPTMLVLMLGKYDISQYNLSNLTIIAYGGAPISENTIRELQEKLPNVKLHNTYGATETTGSATMMPFQESLKRSKSVGLPFLVMEFLVVDERGKPVPEGTVGELWIKGPNVTKGYWNKPEATAKEFTDSYWHSGDLASIDKEGFVYIVDRKKDMINRAGEKVFCVEVENVLCEHPAILEAAVTGVPNLVLGEEVKAVVVLREGRAASEADIREFTANRLADYKVPRYLSFVAELPRNPGGKVIKSLLREL